MRLFSYDKYRGIGGGAGRILYNANRGLEGVSATVPPPHDQSIITVEHGWLVSDYAKNQLNCVTSKLLIYEHAYPKLEKNWVVFRSGLSPKFILVSFPSASPSNPQPLPLTL